MTSQTDITAASADPQSASDAAGGQGNSLPRRDPAGSGPDLAHPAIDQIDLSQVLFALSDPGRRAMVRQMQAGPLEAAACAPAGAELPKATKSHMLKVLREAGVIRNLPNPHRRGRILTLRRADLEGRFPGLIDAVLSADDRDEAPQDAG